MTGIDDGARGAALLAGILEDPADVGARLVYADWLLERGDPRGELIRMYQAGKDTVRLAEAYQPVMTSRYPGVFDRKLDMRSGFLERLQAFAGPLASYPEIFACEPVRVLHLLATSTDELGALRERCQLARITELVLESVWPAALQWRQTRDHQRPQIDPSTILPCFPGLRILDVQRIDEALPAWIELLDSVRAPLETIRIGRAPREMFAHLRRLTTLRAVTVYSQRWFEADSTAALALATMFAEMQLEFVHLIGWHTAVVEVVDTLLRSPSTRIHLQRCTRLPAHDRVTQSL